MPRASRFDSGSLIRLTMLHGLLLSCRRLSLHFCIRYCILLRLLFICETILPIFRVFVNRRNHILTGCFAFFEDRIAERTMPQKACYNDDTKR